jgi:hypothetical protein
MRRARWIGAVLTIGAAAFGASFGIGRATRGYTQPAHSQPAPSSGQTAAPVLRTASALPSLRASPRRPAPRVASAGSAAVTPAEQVAPADSTLGGVDASSSASAAPEPAPAPAPASSGPSFFDSSG